MGGRVGAAAAPRRRADPALRLQPSLSGRLPQPPRFARRFLSFFQVVFSFVWGFSAVLGLSCQVQSKGANFPLRFPPILLLSLMVSFPFPPLKGPRESLRFLYPLPQDFWIRLCLIFLLFSFILVPQPSSPGPPGATPRHGGVSAPLTSTPLPVGFISPLSPLSSSTCECSKGAISPLPAPAPQTNLRENPKK